MKKGLPFLRKKKSAKGEVIGLQMQFSPVPQTTNPEKPRKYRVSVY